MNSRTKALKLKGQQALDPAILAAAASAIPTPLLPNFHQVVEALPAAIYVTDAEGRITYYNTAAALSAASRECLSNCLDESIAAQSAKL